ncbi:MAG: hypothetical protein K2X87_15225 [Gemmataceae bacterium]|nr:hypothetical protein [Gemmataceae bacterium]
MATRDEWAAGYARQADADLGLFERVWPDAAVTTCHKLLLLQMACEKLVKAYLCDSGSDPAVLQTSHAYTAANLPDVVQEAAVRVGYRGSRLRQVVGFAQRLAGEIELLAPAVKRGGQRPDNCEYPWEDAGGVLHVPPDWSFAPTRLLAQPAGRVFLRLVRAAIDELVP